MCPFKSKECLERNRVQVEGRGQQVGLAGNVDCTLALAAGEPLTS